MDRTARTGEEPKHWRETFEFTGEGVLFQQNREHTFLRKM
jgi:hypothetical protein